MIVVEQLTKRYGARTAVDQVSFEVGRGEIVGFLGPNGAGKSTTLRMITGFLSPTAGKIRVGGVDTFEDPIRARQQFGYMPEGVPLYPEMRVHEYLRHRAELKGVPRSGMAKRVGAALEMASITDVENRIIGQLSKGYRQRVGLADAVVADPPLLILDEPTAGLDPNQIRQVRDLVRSFAGKKTVFLSTHILPEVEATCGRVVIINKGRVVGEGAPDTLRGRAAGGGQTIAIVARAKEREGAVELVRGVLARVDGVTEVLDIADVGEGVVRARARAGDGDEVVERVFAACAEAGLLLRELGRTAERLEDVFASLTTEDSASDSESEPEPDSEPDSESESEPDSGKAKTDGEGGDS